nr:ulp1 protease family protein [Colletotrichum truncatum]KAF6790151.1 ulp1 protease family protein [Colletotrichum truncatum]
MSPPEQQAVGPPDGKDIEADTQLMMASVAELTKNLLDPKSNRLHLRYSIHAFFRKFRPNYERHKILDAFDPRVKDFVKELCVEGDRVQEEGRMRRFKQEVADHWNITPEDLTSMFEDNKSRVFFEYLARVSRRYPREETVKALEEARMSRRSGNTSLGVSARRPWAPADVNMAEKMLEALELEHKGKVGTEKSSDQHVLGSQKAKHPMSPSSQAPHHDGKSSDDEEDMSSSFNWPANSPRTPSPQKFHAGVDSETVGTIATGNSMAKNLGENEDQLEQQNVSGLFDQQHSDEPKLSRKRTMRSLSVHGTDDSVEYPEVATNRKRSKRNSEGPSQHRHTSPLVLLGTPSLKSVSSSVAGRKKYDKNGSPKNKPQLQDTAQDDEVQEADAQPSNQRLPDVDDNSKSKENHLPHAMALKTLASGHKLDDDAINTCLHLLVRATRIRDFQMIPSLFAVPGAPPQKFIKTSISKARVVIVPLHLTRSGHWVLSIFDTEDRQVGIIDSLPTRNGHVAEELNELLLFILGAYFGDDTDWEISHLPGPLQANDIDCGLLLLVNALYLLTGQPAPESVNTEFWRRIFMAFGGSSAQKHFILDNVKNETLAISDVAPEMPSPGTSLFSESYRAAAASMEEYLKRMKSRVRTAHQQKLSILQEHQRAAIGALKVIEKLFLSLTEAERSAESGNLDAEIAKRRAVLQAMRAVSPDNHDPEGSSYQKLQSSIIKQMERDRICIQRSVERLGVAMTYVRQASSYISQQLEGMQEASSLD